MHLDIITIGSATLDLFIETHPEIILKNKTRQRREELLAYPLGAKILVKKIHVQTGGGGTNSAVAFSRLGLKTAFFGVLGRDKEASIIYDMLKKERIRFIGKLGKESGISIVLDAVGKDRTILIYRGDNDKIKFEKEDKEKFKNAKAIYIAPLHGKAVEAGLSITKFAKKQGIKIFMNVSSYMIEHHHKEVLEMMKDVELFVCNFEEANEILRTKYDERDYEKILIELWKLGPKRIVVTNGSKGLVGYDGKKFVKLNPRKHIKVVDTTGAGDAFASTCSAFLLKGINFKTSCLAGLRNAESVISKFGAKAGLLRKEELIKIIEQEINSKKF